MMHKRQVCNALAGTTRSEEEGIGWGNRHRMTDSPLTSSHLLMLLLLRCDDATFVIPLIAQDFWLSSSR